MSEINRRSTMIRLFAGLAVLAFLSFSCSSSDSRAGDSKAAVAAKADQPCADCPPAGAVAPGSRAASGRRHLAKDARPKSRRSPEEMAQTGEKLGDVLAKLSEASAESLSETYDPQAIVDKAGSDIEPLFAWVRDNTYLVPYRGSLRGPVGVLMDRLGNSLDRALLLHDLLVRAGYEARLAHADLTEGQARDLLRGAAVPPTSAGPAGMPALTAGEKKAIEGLAADYGLDEKALFRAVEDEAARREGLSRRASEGEAAILPKLLDLTAKRRTQDPDEETRQAIEDLRDHWWVQAETESGTVDLDPSLTDAAPGKAMAEASETTTPDGLDEGLHHKVILRVVTETWAEGRLSEQELLRREFRPSEAAGVRMVLSHAPSDWPDTLDILRGKDAPKRLHDTILKQKGWTPVLMFGEDEENGFGISDAGRIQAKSAPEKSSGGSEPQAADGKSVLTAEWIEYEILSPGRPARKVRREVFDLIGPSGRAASVVPPPRINDAARMARSLALLGRTEILPLFCRWSAEYARYLADGHLLAGQETLLSFYDAEVLKKPEDVLEKLSGMDRLPAALYRLALARPVAGDYVAAPNISSLRSVFWEDGKGTLQRGAVIDVVDNRAAVHPARAEDAFRTRLARGVRDSVRESVLSWPEDEDDPLARFYREADRAAVGWLAASRDDASALAKAELPPDLVARLRGATEEGDVVVFPKREVVVDGRPVVRWWRVDPATGDALVFDERGWGQAMTGYVQKVERIVQLKGWVDLGADILKCALTGVIAAVGDDTETDANAFLTCIQVVLCNQMYSQFEDYCDLETNWTNFILKQIAGYLAGEFCDVLMSEF